MKTKSTNWKKGRGKLGVLAPLMGTWQAKSDSEMGKYTCSRTFTPVLDGKYIELNAKWDFGKKVYEERALYGVQDGKLSFWSFTSDGKQSTGALSSAPDIHPDAICFEAKMPAGIARMIYWPNGDGTVNWAIESKNKKGWNRFTLHVYRRD
jgi:hypothetical protein